MTEVLENAALFGIRRGDVFQIQNPTFGIDVPAQVVGFTRSTIDKNNVTKSYLKEGDLDPVVSVQLRELEAPHYVQEFSVVAVLNGQNEVPHAATRISLVTGAEIGEDA